MGKTLGIDYGTKRVGLAISDETLTLARELAILSPKEFFAQIQGLVQEHEISEIILGLPLNMSGEDTQKTAEVREFKKSLEELITVPVILRDERLSSVMASNMPGGQTNVDSLAAQIVLQNYLDQTKNKML
jgi:putative holliday junction resolvase